MSRKWLLTVLAVVTAFALIAAPAVAMAVPSFVTDFTTGLGVGTMHVATDGYGNVYTTDQTVNQVVKFGSTGAVLKTFNNNGSAPMNSPRGVFVTPAQQVFVTEYDSDRVDEYTSEGVHVRTIGLTTGGTGNGAFNTPSSVFVDRFGFVYVLDMNNYRMQKFSPSGTYLAQWPMHTASGFRYGFTMDTHGNFYVPNYTSGQVEVYSKTGTYLTQWPCTSATSAVFGPDGKIYVTSADGNIRAFTPAGALYFTFGSGFDWPFGIAADGNAFYIADFNNARVRKYSLGQTKTVTRIGGADRWAVAVNLAATRWPGFAGIHDVIVVCGEDRAMADPLASAGLAGIWDAPILLTTSSKLQSTTANALAQIRAANGPLAIHVIGGTTSVSNKTYAQLAATNPGGTIDRISGKDRYILSANIANRARAEADARGITIRGVMIFNAENSKAFYDALAASPAAACSGIPMLAVRAKSVPAEVSASLASNFPGKPRAIVNSAAYITPANMAAVGGWARMSNSSEYKTSATQIATAARLWGWVPLTNVGVAAKLPDSLTGGSFVGLNGGVILYTDKATFPAVSSNFVGLAKPGTLNGWVFGGPASVADSALNQFGNVLNTP